MGQTQVGSAPLVAPNPGPGGGRRAEGPQAGMGGEGWPGPRSGSRRKDAGEGLSPGPVGCCRHECPCLG